MTTSTITLNPGTGGDKPLVDTLTTVDGAAAPAGASSQMVKVGFGAASDFKTASSATPLPVAVISNSGLSDTQLRATPVPVSGTVAVSNMVAQGITDTQIRATPLPVSGTVAVSNMVAQGLTDTQIRATALPVSGTFFQPTQPVSGTFFQATQPVSGAFFQATQPVSGALSITSNGIISTANSTSVALAANGVFTGPAEDITEFADVRIIVFADQPSAVDGLQLQQSVNGTNWDSLDVFTVPALTGRPFSLGASAKFYRVVYTNGATAQTVFRLQTKLYKAYGKGASVRPQDGRSNENDFEEVLGFSMVYNGTSWDRMRGTTANGIAADITRLPALVAGSAVIGATNINTAVTSAVTVLQNAVAVTGNGTSLPVTGYGTAVLQITGTFVASIAFEASVDAGTTWFAISATQVGQGDIFNTASLPGLYRMTVAGLDLIRARVTWTSGTSITINGRTSNAVNASKIVKLATSGLTIGTVLMAGVTSVTTLSVANTAVTLTLPAPAAGQFHYVTRIRITLHNTSAAAVVGSALALAFTSANLPGALAWTDGNALAAGTSKTVVDEVLPNGLKVSAAATATTITAPIAGAGVQSRITAYYYTGP